MLETCTVLSLPDSMFCFDHDLTQPRYICFNGSSANPCKISGIPRILNLGLYSPGTQYDQMIESTKQWYKQCETLGVTTLYYFYDSTVNKCHIDFQTMMIRIPGKETYLGILDKTLEAFRVFWGVEKTYSLFDFVVRSNASTVVNFFTLCPLIKKTNLFYGSPHILRTEGASTSIPLDPVIFPLEYAHGTCLILRADAVCFLLQNEKKLSREIEDDSSIGVFFKQIALQDACEDYYLPVRTGNQYALFKTHYNLDDAVAFRNHQYGSDRKEDTQNVQLAVDALLQRYTFLNANQLVDSVFYATKDVTSHIVNLCKTKEWITEQKNTELDLVFGDPTPGFVKTLTIYFPSHKSFKQAATLTFSCKNGHLFVK